MKPLLAALVLMALTPAVPARGQQPAGTLRVNVKLVNVFCTVTDAQGAPVAGLKKEDFQLSEDGETQKIAVFDRESELPLSIVLALDTSLSTHKDLRLELESAKTFARQILRPVDALSVYRFDEEVHEVVPFTSNLKRIDQGLDRMHTGAATALYDAVWLGSRALLKRQGRKVMVLITDGGDTASKLDYADALRAAEESEAIVYSIIIVPIEADAGRNTGGEHALIQLSHDTGGKYYYAQDTRQLDEAFRQIDEELRTQYLLAYYPSQRVSSSEFRRIEVQVTGAGHEGYIVRHRSGYYTMSAE
jgi:Ca-activated chloride channel family protein